MNFDNYNHLVENSHKKMFPCPAIGGQKIDKIACQDICGNPLGNNQCLSLKCRSSWLFCPHCREQLPREVLPKLEGMVIVDGANGCCFTHKMNGPEFSLLTMRSVREKLIEEHPKLFEGIPEPVKPAEKPAKKKYSFPKKSAWDREVDRYCVPVPDEDEVDELEEELGLTPQPSKADDLLSLLDDELTPAAINELVEEKQASVDDAVKETTQPIEGLKLTAVTEIDETEGETFIEVSRILPSTVGPRKVFLDEDIEKLAKKLEIFGQTNPVVLIRRGGFFEIFRGEEIWQAAKKQGVAKLSVKFLQRKFGSEAEEYLESAVVNREVFTSLEMARILKHLKNLFPNYTKYQIADSFSGTHFNARQWFDNHLKLLTLHPRVIRIMEMSIPAGQRLTLEDVLRYKFFEMPMTSQEAKAKQLISLRKIELPYERSVAKVKDEKVEKPSEIKSDEVLRSRLEKRLNNPDARGRFHKDLAAYVDRCPEVIKELGFKKEGRKYKKITSDSDRRSSRAISVATSATAPFIDLEEETIQWFLKPGHKGNKPARLAAYLLSRSPDLPPIAKIVAKRKRALKIAAKVAIVATKQAVGASVSNASVNSNLVIVPKVNKKYAHLIGMDDVQLEVEYLKWLEQAGGLGRIPWILGEYRNRRDGVVEKQFSDAELKQQLDEWRKNHPGGGRKPDRFIRYLARIGQQADSPVTVSKPKKVEAPQSSVGVGKKSVEKISKDEKQIDAKSFEVLKQELSEKLNEVSRKGRFPQYLTDFVEAHPEVVAELGFRKYRRQYKKIKSAKIQVESLIDQKNALSFADTIEGGFCSTVEVADEFALEISSAVDKIAQIIPVRIVGKAENRVACVSSEDARTDYALEIELQKRYKSLEKRGDMPDELKDYLKRRPEHLPRIVRKTDTDGKRRMMMVDNSGENMQALLSAYFLRPGSSGCPPKVVYDFLQGKLPLLLALAAEPVDVRELKIERIVLFDEKP